MVYQKLFLRNIPQLTYFCSKSIKASSYLQLSKDAIYPCERLWIRIYFYCSKQKRLQPTFTHFLLPDFEQLWVSRWTVFSVILPVKLSHPRRNSLVLLQNKRTRLTVFNFQKPRIFMFPHFFHDICVFNLETNAIIFSDYLRHLYTTGAFSTSNIAIW